MFVSFYKNFWNYHNELSRPSPLLNVPESPLIQFNSEEERLRHAQAALIPKLLWDNIFEEGLNETDLWLMQSTLSEETQFQFQTVLISNDRIRVALAVMLSHRDLSVNELVHLGFNLNEIFVLAFQIMNKAVLDELVVQYPEFVFDEIPARDYMAFRYAADCHRFDIMEFLMSLLSPGQAEDMIKARYYEAFKQIMGDKKGIDTIVRMMRLSPNNVQDMIAINNYELFGFAAQLGRNDLMEWMMSLSLEHKPHMIQAKERAIFYSAIEDGQGIDALLDILSSAQNSAQDLIAFDDYSIFRSAIIDDGRVELMEWMMSFSPDSVQDMIASGEYELFRNAPDHAFTERLMSLSPNHVRDMIKADDYSAFRELSSFRSVYFMNRVRSWLSQSDIEDMIQAEHYQGVSDAIDYGELDVLELVIALVPDLVDDMMEDSGYLVFRNAVQHGNPEIIHYLLQFPINLAYAEMHRQEYGQYTTPFITERLSVLRNSQIAFETSHPLGVFNVDGNEARLCFYIIRNLIRQTVPELSDDIRFLLKIPAVNALAHTPVTANEHNELLRLALIISNQETAEILLDMCPRVRSCAEQNAYYRAELSGFFDLSVLAQDRESSMRALTSLEQKRMERVTHRYLPAIKELRGVQRVFQALLFQLEERYQNNRAHITTSDGHDIKLPLRWDDFNKLILSEDTRKQALVAYYQNKDHTALRYLSKPNYWMSPRADYVEQCSNRNSILRWSTFESYKPLIVLLWMAAKDINMVPIDGYTLETRLDHFIDELALIGRAHNWDRSRKRKDRNGNDIQEEFDDGEGDKPSCYSGVNRRLFQSVLGHPLLKFLTMNDIKQELISFVREHFTQYITNSTDDSIQSAWTKLCEEGVFDPLLNHMDIAPQARAGFIDYLTTKYATEFTGDPTFKNYIEKSFALTQTFQAHAVRFAAETGLERLLATIKPHQSESRASESSVLPTQEEVRAKRMRFFDPDLTTIDSPNVSEPRAFAP